MIKSITHLSDHITPQTAGIVWLTDEPLNYDSPGVYEFNYLLDGLLVKALDENESKAKNSNFFLGENFGSPLFIGHLVVKNKSDIDTLDDHFKLANSFIQETSTIYIFNKSQNTANLNVLEKLTKKYQPIKFKNLFI